MTPFHSISIESVSPCVYSIRDTQESPHGVPEVRVEKKI
jgi:hypothetical protein